MEQNLSWNYANQYEKRSHSVGISMWHFEWCTKYRYRMFIKEHMKNLVTACIRRTASIHGIKIIELSVEPEHVHCSIGLKLSMSPSTALQILKGLSAKLFFTFCEKARLRYPRGHLWSRGKFATSTGFTKIEVINEYVRNQYQHHKTARIIND